MARVAASFTSAWEDAYLASSFLLPWEDAYFAHSFESRYDLKPNQSASSLSMAWSLSPSKMLRTTQVLRWASSQRVEASMGVSYALLAGPLAASHALSWAEVDEQRVASSVAVHYALGHLENRSVFFPVTVQLDHVSH